MLFYWFIINLLCVPAGIVLVLVNAICREMSDGQVIIRLVMLVSVDYMEKLS